MANTPKDAQELFNEQVPVALSKFPDKAREVNAIYCFKISGEGGGTWSVDLTADPPTCNIDESSNAQCTVEVAHDDFKTMLSDPQAAERPGIPGLLSFGPGFAGLRLRLAPASL